MRTWATSTGWTGAPASNDGLEFRVRKRPARPGRDPTTRGGGSGGAADLGDVGGECEGGAQMVGQKTFFAGPVWPPVGPTPRAGGGPPRRRAHLRCTQRCVAPRPPTQTRTREQEGGGGAGYYSSAAALVL